MDKFDELRRLKSELTEHNYKYYILAMPTISDQTYNMIYKKYIELLEILVGKDTRSLELESDYPFERVRQCMY